MRDFKKLWEELNSLEQEEFGHKSNYEDFQNYIDREDSLLFEMANLRGNDIKLHKRIPFSLFISNKEAVHGAHAIRVKVLWNPEKMTATPDGQLELHGDYDYTAFSHKYNPTSKELDILKDFCKKYKIFFAAIWEGKLDPNDFIDYLENRKSLNDLLSTFILKGKSYYLINHCKNLVELEKCVKKNNIFNLND